MLFVALALVCSDNILCTTVLHMSSYIALSTISYYLPLKSSTVRLAGYLSTSICFEEIHTDQHPTRFKAKLKHSVDRHVKETSVFHLYIAMLSIVPTRRHKPHTTTQTTNYVACLQMHSIKKPQPMTATSGVGPLGLNFPPAPHCAPPREHNPSYNKRYNPGMFWSVGPLGGCQ